MTRQPGIRPTEHNAPDGESGCVSAGSAPILLELHGPRHERWSSRTAFVLAAVGAAVGLGNVWRFPYLAGTSGGGVFVLVYLASVALVALPILVAELLIGRRGHHSPPAAMRAAACAEGRSPLWSLAGWLAVATGFVILTFYSVIGGWVFDYLAGSLGGGLRGTDAQAAQARFQALLADPLRLVLWHTAFMSATAIIVGRGVRRGIERAARVLMPALVLMLLALVGYGAAAGDLGAAVRFLFGFDATRVDAQVVLAAIGQAFFSIGVGMGLMMTYGAYLAREVSLPRTALIIAAADTGVAILAGLAVFALVFGNDLEPAGGPGLVFVTLPIAFAAMPAGTFFGGLFFLLLLVAALTSAVAILEPVVSWAEERRGIGRVRGTAAAAFTAWLIGVGCALSFNRWRDFRPFGWLGTAGDKGLFDLLDHLTSAVTMPLGGILVALFAGWRMSRQATLAELGLADGLLYRTWRWLLRTVVPLAIAAVLLGSLRPSG